MGFRQATGPLPALPDNSSGSATHNSRDYKLLPGTPSAFCPRLLLSRCFIPIEFRFGVIFSQERNCIHQGLVCIVASCPQLQSLRVPLCFTSHRSLHLLPARSYLQTQLVCCWLPSFTSLLLHCRICHHPLPKAPDSQETSALLKATPEMRRSAQKRSHDNDLFPAFQFWAAPFLQAVPAGCQAADRLPLAGGARLLSTHLPTPQHPRLKPPSPSLLRFALSSEH